MAYRELLKEPVKVTLNTQTPNPKDIRPRNRCIEP